MLAMRYEPRYADHMNGMVLWITGLPGSGKSSVADEVKRLHPEFLVLRMDEIRKIVTPTPTYAEDERDLLYRCLVLLAKTMAELGHDVLIDATGNRRRWRELARRTIPRFAEMYLACPIEVCMRREASRKQRHGAPEDIYRKGLAGAPVPGLSVPYEEPDAAEMVIDAERMSVEEAGNAAAKFIALFRREEPDNHGSSSNRPY